MGRIERMIHPVDPDIGIPHNLNEAWEIFLTMKFLASLGIPVAPYAGGFLEWPDWLLGDLAIIAGAEAAIRASDEEKKNGR